MALVHDDTYRFAPATPDDEYVYGACCPGWHSRADHGTAVDRWITFMQDRGIQRVCSLLSGTTGDGTSNVDLYRKAFGPEKVRHAPIPDRRLADPETLRRDILPFLEDAVESDERVVVHCLTGVGQTGQVLAAWLVSHHEYRPPEAVDTIREMGRDPMAALDYGDASRHELLDLLSAVA
ncbi:MAG: hypothetical protein ACI8XM_002842 [Haloarculaceae archaeon]|jgi:hypothetical protein